MANETMGLNYGLENSTVCTLQKFRWLLRIDGISAHGINSLPPLKSNRPSISFKELQVEHLNETIYFPGKPDWKPISLSLYDLKKNTHPVFEWLQRVYNPAVNSFGQMKTPVDNNFILSASLEMYNGCGKILEMWVYENVWPQTIDFGELDMGNNEVVTCDLTLRYARAYIIGQ
jgi:hypothetical protein